MYQFLIILQIFVISASVYSTVMLSRLRSAVDNKFLFVTSFCINIYAAGYLVEMRCRSVEAVRIALAFEYMGLSFIALSFAIFIFNYCHAKWFKRWVARIMFIYCLVVCFSVFTSDINHIYYKDMYMEDSGVFMHVVTEKTPLYFSFAAYQAIIMCIGAVVIYQRRKTVKKPSERKRLLFLLLECLIPLFGLICTVTINLGGWDASPLLLTFLVTSTSVTLKRGKFTDVISIAREEMFTKIGSAFIIADSTQMYLDSNQAATDIFDELEYWESGHDMSTLTVDLFDCENGEKYFDQEGRYYHSVVNSLYEKNEIVGYVVSITDMTDMRQQMNEMKALKEEADAASEAKSAFLANMSHEIRTPLNAIIGMAELSEKEQSESVKNEYNQQIKSAGKMLLGIVSDVLDFSKAESGKLELVPVEFDTAEFLNSVINVVNMRIGDKPIDFIVDIDPNIPKKIYGDDVHLRQIFMNLLSNAEKFTNEGHIRFSLGSKIEGHGVKLFGEVEDTGIGIKEEDTDRLFVAFQQLDAKRNRKINGSGLGLAIFAQLVTLMNGTYRVESEYGKGSTFFFDVELDIVDSEPFAPETEREAITVQKVTAFSLYGTAKEIVVEEEKKEEKASNIPDYSNYSLLVVDDNKVNVKVLCAFLKHFNVVADTAFSGKEAIEKVGEKQYDLIFMDHMMPEMDGVETTMNIREMDPDWVREVPIIACTANVVKGIEEMFMQAGMNDFVPKPIQLEVLQEKMAKYLK